jgi:hypothetical protein
MYESLDSIPSTTHKKRKCQVNVEEFAKNRNNLKIGVRTFLRTGSKH